MTDWVSVNLYNMGGSKYRKLNFTYRTSPKLIFMTPFNRNTLSLELFLFFQNIKRSSFHLLPFKNLVEILAYLEEKISRDLKFEMRKSSKEIT